MEKITRFLLSIILIVSPIYAQALQPKRAKTELQYVQPFLNQDFLDEVPAVETIMLEDSDIRAFAGAEGFGRNAGLGLPRRVRFVTNLNNTGSGSLRSAIDEAEVEPDSLTVIIPRVGGTILTGSDPFISGTDGDGIGNMYIAGQAAPGDGINIRGDNVTYGGILWLRGSNTIVRYIRIHGGSATASGVDALTIATQKNTTAHTVENIIIDHNSFYWGKDENIEVGAYDGSTMQNVSLTHNIYAENFGTGYGVLFYSTEGYMDNISFYGNLGVDIKERQPYMSSCNQEYEVLNNMLLNTQHVNNFSVNKIDWVGNHYKWNSNYPMTDGGNFTFNYSVNTYELSPNIATCPSDPGCCDNASLGDLPLYVGDNLLTNDTSGNSLFSTSLTTYNASSRVITESLITPISSSNVESSFISHVGASLVRDGHDTRVTNEFIANDRNYRPTGEADSNVGGHEIYSNGTPYTDTDGDGLSDAYETAQGGNVDINGKPATFVLSDGKIVNQSNVTNYQTDGFSHIDVFLSDLAGDWDGFEIILTNPVEKIVLTDDDIKAFPTALGYGQNTKGGKGGAILFVNSLASTDTGTYDPVTGIGSGTFRWAKNQDFPRQIIFNTSGTIDLGGSTFTIFDGDVTIYGQSAPGDGITLVNGNFRPNGASEVIIRFLRVRDAPAGFNIASTVNGYAGVIATDVIWDHCSITGGNDENFSVGASGSGAELRRVTLQKCIVAEGDDDTFYYATLLATNSYEISFIRNFYMNHMNRVPEHTYGDGSTFEWVNNLIYNYNRAVTMAFGTSTLESIGNVWKADADFPPAQAIHHHQLNGIENPNGTVGQGVVWEDDNIEIGAYTNPYGMTNSNWEENNTLNNRTERTLNSPYTPVSSALVEDLVLNDVGPTTLFSDPYDERLFTEYENSTGDQNGLGHSAAPVNVVTRPAGYDTDGDGLSDEYEEAQGGNVNPNDITDEYVLSNGVIVDQSNVTNYQTEGYTHLEVFMADKAKDWDGFETVTVGGNNSSKQKRRINTIIISNN